jgi:Glycosyltransferase family 28 C-terminal domain
MTAEPLEYPRSDWPASVRMVGPCCWDPPDDPPMWLAEIDQPIVLVSTSSEFQDDGRLVTTALEALADEDVHVVATIPAAEIPRTKVPANAHVEQFVPHAPILARAACAVTHGGAGVTQKALAARVPVCVVPFGRDQLEVARRVDVADAGTRLPARRLTPDRLRAKIREAMTKRVGANRVADGFAATGGPTTAAEAIEELSPCAAAPRGRCIRRARPDSRLTDIGSRRAPLVLTVAPASVGVAGIIFVGGKIIINAGFNTGGRLLVTSQVANVRILFPPGPPTRTALASAAKNTKRCKRGQALIKVGNKTKCVSSSFGMTTKAIPAAGSYGIKLSPNAAVRKAVNKGRTLHVKVTLTFKPTAGGKPAVRTQNITIKRKKH